jgi:hypothetical protein
MLRRKVRIADHMMNASGTLPMIGSRLDAGA